MRLYKMHATSVSRSILVASCLQGGFNAVPGYGRFVQAGLPTALNVSRHLQAFRLKEPRVPHELERYGWARWIPTAISLRKYALCCLLTGAPQYEYSCRMGCANSPPIGLQRLPAKRRPRR
ncbi:hypothetical protein RSOLAG1IB_03800 [Rhizoctonia solani AG-1 IB]|uniref:Uncharacterized protein n=1 Tax=Thanatephorus cucumeris (strain AG1-IB / isolate 7/3/14) TaxID=1108050 RepID=A0A0B7FPF8_THACB|nr:hypothetical protein RSOLAG1IB_03800 [Rhizoctonia solani AG-1 IB]